MYTGVLCFNVLENLLINLKIKYNLNLSILSLAQILLYSKSWHVKLLAC